MSATGSIGLKGVCSMYRCDSCGMFFEEPIIVKDDPSPGGVSLVGGYYIEKYCPNCNGQDMTEAKQCAVCGKWHTNDGVLCEDCMEEIGYEIGEVGIRYGLMKDDFTDAVVTLIERGTI